jgi:hypothetical protein
LHSADAESNIIAVLDVFNPVCLEEEAPYRAAIRLYHDLWLESHAQRKAGHAMDTPIRAGRRMYWLARASEALKERMPEETWQRMQYALALTTGIDSVAIMRDVCGIEDDEELLGVLRWTAQAILAAAYAEAGIEP